MKTRNDCEIACDCVKHANVVLHVGLCEEIFARKHTATHKPTSAQPLSAPHSYQRDIHLTRSLVAWIDLHLLVSRSINMLGVTDFDPNGIISGVRVHAGLYLDMLDADRSPNAVSVHAGTSQVDFEVDRPPPAPPGHLLITMVKEAVFCTKNEFWKMKKSRISHWSESDENAKWLRDCLWLCQACKRGFTCRPM